MLTLLCRPKLTHSGQNSHIFLHGTLTFMAFSMVFAFCNITQGLFLGQLCVVVNCLSLFLHRLLTVSSFQPTEEEGPTIHYYRQLSLKKASEPRKFFNNFQLLCSKLPQPTCGHGTPTENSWSRDHNVSVWLCPLQIKPCSTQVSGVCTKG